MSFTVTNTLYMNTGYWQKLGNPGILKVANIKTIFRTLSSNLIKNTHSFEIDIGKGKQRIGLKMLQLKSLTIIKTSREFFL